jgi:hypothetical protein
MDASYRVLLGLQFVDNKYDFKLIVEHKSFVNCVFKNYDLKTQKICFFKS